MKSSDTYDTYETCDSDTCGSYDSDSCESESDEDASEPEDEEPPRQSANVHKNTDMAHSLDATDERIQVNNESTVQYDADVEDDCAEDADAVNMDTNTTNMDADMNMDATDATDTTANTDSITINQNEKDPPRLSKRLKRGGADSSVDSNERKKRKTSTMTQPKRTTPQPKIPFPRTNTKRRFSKKKAWMAEDNRKGTDWCCHFARFSE